MREDLTGKRFGNLMVLEMLWGYGLHKRTYTRCRCDCGNEINVWAANLKRNDHISCGCKNIAPANKLRKDISGQRFGMLLVKEVLWNEKPIRVRCLCDCGNETTPIKKLVIRGNTQSCGCLQRKASGEINSIDWTGVVSNYGIEFLYPEKRNSKSQWLWKCKCGVCGKEFTAMPVRVMNGDCTSCGCAKMPSKERLISRLLDSIGARYTTQFSFDNCRNTNPLQFDFAVFDNIGNITCLIEYDGKQHFKPIDFFGGRKSFDRQKICDETKNEYCTKNNISLLRLPYTLTDEEIIEKITNIINP